jgi:hypothetical protein
MYIYISNTLTPPHMSMLNMPGQVNEGLQSRHTVQYHVCTYAQCKNKPVQPSPQGSGNENQINGIYIYIYIYIYIHTYIHICTI